MKIFILVFVILFSCLNLSANDKVVSFSFSDVKTFNKEITTAFGLKLNPKLLESCSFEIAYANNKFSKSTQILDIKNPSMQNLYLSVNYRF